jgi:hypothetical protein
VNNIIKGARSKICASTEFRTGRKKSIPSCKAGIDALVVIGETELSGGMVLMPSLIFQ